MPHDLTWRRVNLSIAAVSGNFYSYSVRKTVNTNPLDPDFTSVNSWRIGLMKD